MNIGIEQAVYPKNTIYAYESIEIKMPSEK